VGGLSAVGLSLSAIAGLRVRVMAASSWAGQQFHSGRAGSIIWSGEECDISCGCRAGLRSMRHLIRSLRRPLEVRGPFQA
jgi:hypothetical protein